MASKEKMPGMVRRNILTSVALLPLLGLRLSFLVFAWDEDSSEPSKDIMPGMVVFDLDGTLWYPEMYMLYGGSPFHVDKKSGDVRDSNGEFVQLMGSSRAVLYALKKEPKFENTLVAIASRTDEPRWADECMRKIEVGDGITMKETVHYEAIYKGDKTNHFRELAKKSKVPMEDMIFFDNEMGNIRSVSRLGVHCVYTPQGVTAKVWEKALKDYQSLKQAEPAT